MNLKEIRESGLLELYLLGMCNDTDKQVVEDALARYPELQNDVQSIGDSLETYAKIHQVQPSPGLKEKILQDARSKDLFESGIKEIPKNSSWKVNTLAMTLGALLLGMLAWHFSRQSDFEDIQEEYEILKAQCDSIHNAAERRYAIINQLQSPDNQIIPLTPTEDYQSTQLSLVYNKAQNTNFIQVQNLPNITDQQSFQLWSLKTDQAPIPLTVFQGTEGIFIPVDYEEGTATYAITIEPYGGQEAPSLDQLIATVTI